MKHLIRAKEFFYLKRTFKKRRGLLVNSEEHILAFSCLLQISRFHTKKDENMSEEPA
ncbi:hypothetical protein RND71_040156 [Anisodus tanguticus]|uniref:Uncharacterized protein n=1 Tax=Anisodus tanguticus TaxID=243964 RepID=A0AAE1QXW3_9SOLA|nr:hypothetical protein RND71_040156 [Anisodus tanguticus]